MCYVFGCLVSSQCAMLARPRVMREDVLGFTGRDVRRARAPARDARPAYEPGTAALALKRCISRLSAQASRAPST